MVEWPSGFGRAPSCFIAHAFDGSRVQSPGADTVNQAVHPSGVGKLVATSIQWVTAVEDCGCKCVLPYDGWHGLMLLTPRKLPMPDTGGRTSSVKLGYLAYGR